MKILSLIGFTGLLLTAAPAHSADWNLDPAHSNVSFKVRHLAVSSVRGEFSAVSGTLHFDQKDIKKTKVNIEIDVASINTNNEKRDGHLRSADFFDVEKYPKMKFVSTHVRKAGEGLAITGKLTMHGKTLPLTLNVTEVSQTVKGPYGFYRKGFTASAKLDRRKYGLTWSQVLETGGLVVGNEITINIEAQFMHK